MNRADFEKSPAGCLVPTVDQCLAFVPNPLPPPNIDLARLAFPLASASHALGELSGIGRTLPNPELLISPFSRAEAVASSKIEGTVTSTPDLLMLELSPEGARANSDTREVNNYNAALRHGLKRISTLPLSKRLFNELHEILLKGVAADRGARFIPGELRKDQNWIGARTVQNARFVPPPPGEVLNLLDDLEKFLHRENEDIPSLIKLAMVHYQFETIHPYPDGNGRIGRLLIPLALCERNEMSQPLLYISSYFETNYNKYIDYMFAVSSLGAWEQWIEFFLQGVEVSARKAIKKIHALEDLRSQYMQRLREARTSGLLPKLVDCLFEIPVITVPHAASELNVSYNSAKNSLKRLIDLQILQPYVGNERPQWFFAEEIIRIADSD